MWHAECALFNNKFPCSLFKQASVTWALRILELVTMVPYMAAEILQVRTWVGTFPWIVRLYPMESYVSFTVKRRAEEGWKWRGEAPPALPSLRVVGRCWQLRISACRSQKRQEHGLFPPPFIKEDSTAYTLIEALWDPCWNFNLHNCNKIIHVVLRH